MLTATFRPRHDENRMRHEGDVVRARRHFFESSSPNLRRLLENRYSWMNRYIGPQDRGIEVGCGTGVSKEFIRSRSFLLTDFAAHDWIDVKNVDALATPFEDDGLQFVVSSNMLHHVPHPLRFFREMCRILQPGGHLLIQEINASIMMRAVLRLMKHEGYSFEPDVFDESVICTDPEDLWSANCAIPNLVFDDRRKFEEHVPYFEVVEQGYSEFFTFLNSGGVIAKTFHVPLPRLALRALEAVDVSLTSALPEVFALQRRIVLRKRPPGA